ncbi:hypothetical protein B0H17DRAFT_1139764 [Mycena rosella]|uniref:Uncharacterized protein n=1 Tax=Mycena rosella TaxID=1033263 RepID=A0AAD7D781_MYCRO|nr:hypothetical protein B0H17DRAFT_1139764 [Mycena rosella]
MSLSDFVNGLFDRLFFGQDEAAGLAALENEVASDAVFDINGKTASRAQFLETIRGFHASGKVKLNTIQDLAVVPSGSGGVVAQTSKFTVMSGGGAKEQQSVRIVKVEERGGKKVMTSLVEVQA